MVGTYFISKTLIIFSYDYSAAYPFKEVQGNEVPHDMLQGKFAFNKPVWNKISANCKNFITLLLQKDAKNRLTSEEALKHIWFAPIYSKVGNGDGGTVPVVSAPKNIPILPKAIFIPTSPIPIPGAKIPALNPNPNTGTLSVSHSFLTHMEEGMQLNNSTTDANALTDRELMPPPSSTSNAAVAAKNNKKRKVADEIVDGLKEPGDAEPTIQRRVTRAKSKK